MKNCEEQERGKVRQAVVLAMQRKGNAEKNDCQDKSQCLSLEIGLGGW